MMHVSPSLRRRLLMTGALPVLAAAFLPAASAQVELTEPQTAGVETATAGPGGTPSDVTTTSAATINLTTAGPALTLNSDNALFSGGAITITDVDNATGILVDTSTALTGSLSVTGNVTIDESFTATDDDNDRIVDGSFAQGEGRTGILISGADTFTGPVDVAATSSILVEGNNSAGIRVMEAAGLVGDANFLGRVSAIGDNVRGVDLRAPVTGNATIGGFTTTATGVGINTVTALGEGASAVDVSGDISDRLTVSGNIRNTGNRNLANAGQPIRQPSVIRDLYDAEDTLEAGNAVNVSGNVGGGIYLSSARNADGVAVGATTISQVGTAAAVLIAGNGTPIIVGRVADITDSADENFDANLQYSLVNEAIISGASVLDDRDATGLRIANADLTDGFINIGQISSQSYRAPVADGDMAATTDIAVSTAVNIGAGATLPALRNINAIAATTTEAADRAYADEDNILAPNTQLANGILIEAGANVAAFENAGVLSSTISGRSGTAYALVDQSGSLAVIDNQGIIRAGGSNSDPQGLQDTEFTLVAVDVSANTSGITLTQSLIEDINPDDGIDPPTPLIEGDVLLGSGADTVDVQSGAVLGGIRFGDGADILTIAEDAAVGGALNDSDGDLTLNVAGLLGLTSTSPLNARKATFTETSTFTPFIDGDTGAASTLMTSGTVTFEDGASIAPILANVVGGDDTTFLLVDAGTLTLNGDIATLQPATGPFLYNTEITRPAGTETLVATLGLKTTAELGLDGPQTAAFGSTFNAISSDAGLSSAFARLTDQASFNAAYNQLLPDFNASVARFVHSNTDGATGAVSTHLKNARLSDVKPGGAWIEEFAYFADRELAGLSEAYRGYGFGFAGGFDTAFGPFHTAGINFGYAATEVEDVVGMDSPLAVQTFQTGVYAGWERGGLGVDVYAGGGYNNIESNRSVEIGTFAGTTQAEWGGTHLNASLSAGYDFAFGERYFMRPSVNVSYLTLTEDSYEESGSDAIRFSVDERTSDIGSATAMLNFGAKFDGDRIWWSPAIRVGLINDFEGSGILTRATYFDSSSASFDPSGAITLAGQNFPDSGILFGLSIAAGSNYSSFGLDYDADLRDGYNRHIARLVLRLLF